MRKILSKFDLKPDDIVVIDIDGIKDYATLHALFEDGTAIVTRQSNKNMLTIPNKDILAYVDYNKSLGGVFQSLGNCKGYFITI